MSRVAQHEFPASLGLVGLPTVRTKDRRCGVSGIIFSGVWERFLEIALALLIKLFQIVKRPAEGG